MHQPEDLVVRTTYVDHSAPVGVSSVSTTNQGRYADVDSAAITTVYTDAEGRTPQIEQPDPGSGADANADFWVGDPNAQPDHALTSDVLRVFLCTGGRDYCHDHDRSTVDAHPQQRMS
ncbi:MAG: hypothetical protein R3C02_18800 [Planctomycetaceae bacterium]